MDTREPAERYRFERILRSTQSGTVMEGADLQSGRPVVVKVLHPGPPEGVAEARAGFEKLVEALQSLKHPAFPALLDAGFAPDGTAFLVLERLIGRPLDRAAGDSAVRAVALLAQAAAGLEALAKEGVAHGNLAPDDVLVVDPRPGGPRNEEGQIKLLGLGTCPFHQPPGEPDVTALARVACQALRARYDAARGHVEIPPLVASSLHDPEPFRKALERSLKPPVGGPPTAGEVQASFLAALRRTVPAAAAPAAPAAAAAMAGTVAPAGLATPSSVGSLLPGLDGDDLGPRHDVLSDITDDLLRAAPEPLAERPVAAAPRAAPAPRSSAAVAPPAAQYGSVPAPAPAPVSASRRRALVIGLGAALALILVLGLVGFLVLGRAPAPAPVLVAAPPAPPPPEPAPVRLDRAIGFMAAGMDGRARELLASLTTEDQASLGPERCSRLALAQQLLRFAARDGLERDLPRALESGGLAAVVELVRAALAEGVSAAGLYPGAEQDFARASRLAELYSEAERAGAAGTPLRVLEVYRALEAELPGQRDGFGPRERAAAALAIEARDRARQGDYTGGLARLADLGRLWPEAPGLDDEVESLRAQQEAEPVQQGLLDTLTAFERRKKPDEALAELARHEPTLHLAPAFATARDRFAAQLAALDQAPPVVELREGYVLQYARGTVAELSFRVRDDYQVADVKVLGRRAGSGSMREIPHRRDGFGYTIALGPDYHGNETVELCVVATDVSGHEGTLGSPAQPLRLERIQGFERMVGN